MGCGAGIEVRRVKASSIKALYTGAGVECGTGGRAVVWWEAIFCDRAPGSSFPNFERAGAGLAVGRPGRSAADWPASRVQAGACGPYFAVVFTTTRRLAAASPSCACARTLSTLAECLRHADWHANGRSRRWRGARLMARQGAGGNEPQLSSFERERVREEHDAQPLPWPGAGAWASCE